MLYDSGTSGCHSIVRAVELLLWLVLGQTITRFQASLQYELEFMIKNTPATTAPPSTGRDHGNDMEPQRCLVALRFFRSKFGKFHVGWDHSNCWGLCVPAVGVQLFTPVFLICS